MNDIKPWHEYHGDDDKVHMPKDPSLHRARRIYLNIDGQETVTYYRDDLDALMNEIHPECVIKSMKIFDTSFHVWLEWPTLLTGPILGTGSTREGAIRNAVANAHTARTSTQQGSTDGTGESEVDRICEEILGMGWTSNVGKHFDDFANCYWATAHRTGERKPAIYHFAMKNFVSAQGLTRVEAARDLIRAVKEKEEATNEH